MVGLQQFDWPWKNMCETHTLICVKPQSWWNWVSFYSRTVLDLILKVGCTIGWMAQSHSVVLNVFRDVPSRESLLVPKVTIHCSAHCLEMPAMSFPPTTWTNQPIKQNTSIKVLHLNMKLDIGLLWEQAYLSISFVLPPAAYYNPGDRQMSKSYKRTWAQKTQEEEKPHEKMRLFQLPSISR